MSLCTSEALCEKIQSHLGSATEGLCLHGSSGGEMFVQCDVGHTYEQYDLASLTKVIFTTSAVMWAEQRGLLKVEQEVGEFSNLSWFPYPEITLFQLLTHTSGLPWWLPFDQERRTDRLDLQNFLSQISKESSVTKAVYSDVGFWVLGFVLESAYGQSLLQIWQDMKKEFQWSGLNFHVNNNFEEEEKVFAPTQVKELRGGLQVGVVDDDNCWAMGGVSTHAGLFGSLQGVVNWVQWLRKSVKGCGELDPQLVKKFTGRQLPQEVGDWGLGFMKPTAGKASCGQYFSTESFGHTGFTGTSIWWDPKLDLQVVLLSNRVHPQAEPNLFKDLCPRIHDWVIEFLQKEKQS